MDLIVTPTGLSGHVRGLSGRDGRYLSDMRASKANKIPDYILASCWTDTAEPGIYTIGDGRKPDWGTCLIGDRDYTLLQIRIQSYGPAYTFKISCQRPTCRERFEWDIDLDQLPVRRLKKKDRETFLAGNRFETEIPEDGRVVTFKLAVGNDAVRAAAHRKDMRAKQRGAGAKIEAESNLLVESILMRVLAIQGVDEKNPRRKIERHRDVLEDLPMRALAGLLDNFDDHDCGVETTIEVVCPACEEPQDVQLPFDGDFFFPRKSSAVVGSTMRRRTEATTPEEAMEDEEESEEEEPEET